MKLAIVKTAEPQLTGVMAELIHRAAAMTVDELAALVIWGRLRQ
jgi:hypothetical protein